MIRPVRRLMLLLPALLVSASVLAFGPAEEGKEYSVLSRVLPVETGKKIEVVEFFWYRCPHCDQLEPSLAAWAKKLPADVQLRPVPAVFRDDWQPAARIYYTLVEMGVQPKLHKKVFDAYHREGMDLNNETQLLAWAKKQGLDVAKFESTYKAFSTQSQTMRGAQLARDAGIRGVPSLVVDGKYLTTMSMAQTEERLFEVLDQLIERARKERGGKTSAKRTTK